MESRSNDKGLVRFATFEVDLRSGELRKGGVKLKLGGQPFQVLAILLEQPGSIVTREELQQRLWPDTFVDVDHNLNTAINKIREVLADSAEQPAPRRNDTSPWLSLRGCPYPTQRAGTSDRCGQFYSRVRLFESSADLAQSSWLSDCRCHCIGGFSRFCELVR